MIKTDFYFKTTTLFIFALFSFTAIDAQTPTDSLTAEQQDSIRWEMLLEGVNITAQRQLIKQEIDRIGYDVQADEESKTVNVLEMLRKVPLVTIDGEDNILVKGNSNFRIYKNGHPDPNLTKNAKDILKSLPASSVKRIEVITDPGAREDAEGVNAILNIVMMNNSKIDGITGTVSTGISSLERKTFSTFLTTQFGKLILSLDYGYGNLSKKDTKTDGYIYRQFVETGNSEEIISESTNAGNSQYADIDASYEIDTLNLLTASFGGFFYKLDVDGIANTRWYDMTGNPLYSYNENYWLPGYGHHSWNGRFDYEHKTHRQGEKLTFSYMLSLTRQHRDQETNIRDMLNVPFNYNGVMIKSKERFTEHTFQLDYLRPLWEGHRLEMGAKYIFRDNDSKNAQSYYQEPQQEPYKTEFEHTTKVAAAYIDYLYSRGNWSARGGLRYEYSKLTGDYPDGSGTAFDKNLNDWVPQASLKYQINDRQSLKLGYNTSISRPGITYLNPAMIITPGRVDFGNAHLSSARNQSLQLTYMYVGSRLTLQIVPQFNYFNNEIGWILYSDNDITYGTWGNVLKQHRWQMECYAQWQPFNGTTLIGNLTFTDNHAENTFSHLHQHLTDTYYYINLRQKLPWKLSSTAYIFGQVGHGSQNIYAYTRSWLRYGFSLQRSFLSDDRLTVRLTARAPFNKQMHYKTRTTQGDVIGWDDAINAGNGRQFAISVSFRFGKLKSSVKKTETTIENSDLRGGITRGN